MAHTIFRRNPKPIFEERSPHEKLFIGVEARLLYLSLLRDGSTRSPRSRLLPLRLLWWSLERGDAGDPPADKGAARGPGLPRLRVRSSRDAPSARWGVPLSRLRLGGYPLEASKEPTPQEYRSQTYWCGWIDGRFGETGCFTENLNLARYSAPSDRLDYYRGHRAGSEEARLAASTTVGFV